MYIGCIRGVKYSILQVLYKAFYEYSIGHSTEYSIGYSCFVYIGGILHGIFSGILVFTFAFNSVDIRYMKGRKAMK